MVLEDEVLAIGLPPTAEPNSTLGERRLRQAIFLSLPVARGDLAIVTDALRALNDRNIFQAEGFQDVHLESVLIDLATVRDVRLLWLTEAATALGGRPSAEIELPPYCRIDPSFRPTPAVRVTSAEVSAELDDLKHAAASP